jgi:hypothetical protein
MAIVLGPVVKNTSVAYPQSAGDVVANRFEATITAAQPTTDILEIGVIPPNCRLIDAYVDIGGSLGAAGCVFDVGVLNGVHGAAKMPDGTTDRALVAGTEIFTGQTAVASAVARAALPTAFRISPTAVERGIGLKFTTRATGTAATVALVCEFATT